jgi:hypothetical protein
MRRVNSLIADRDCNPTRLAPYQPSALTRYGHPAEVQMLPIAFKRPLSIREIAEHWASELPNTTVVEVQNLLVMAIVENKLSLRIDQDVIGTLKEQAKIATSSDENLSIAITALEKLKITRDGFFRWIDAEGYQRPTFWDSAKADEQELPPAPQNQRVPKKAPERERVKRSMRADVEARKVTIEELLQDKIAWAAKYETGSTTARDAANELAAELKQEKEAGRSQSPDQERPTNDRD